MIRVLNFYNSRKPNTTDNSDKDSALSLLNELQSLVVKGKINSRGKLKEVLCNAGIDPNEVVTKGTNTTCESKLSTKCDEDRGIPTEKGEDETCLEKEKKKKLVSGKCAKPDESDIKQVLRFPHEKLYPRHIAVSERVFDKLNFATLVVGELETASGIDISSKERIPRINIAKTMCYHKAYLKDHNVRDGYDQLLKSIEQVKCSWAEDLGEQLHEYYDY